MIKKKKKIKYWTKRSEKELADYEIDIEEIFEDPEGFLREHDLLPSMSGGRDYTPDYDDDEICYIMLGKRTFSFIVKTGECIEATWCHAINMTDISNFKEIK